MYIPERLHGASRLWLQHVLKADGLELTTEEGLGIKVEFFLAPFFLLCPFSGFGGWLVSARTKPLWQAVAGKN